MIRERALKVVLVVFELLSVLAFGPSCVNDRAGPRRVLGRLRCTRCQRSGPARAVSGKVITRSGLPAAAQTVEWQ